MHRYENAINPISKTLLQQIQPKQPSKAITVFAIHTCFPSTLNFVDFIPKLPPISEPKTHVPNSHSPDVNKHAAPPLAQSALKVIHHTGYKSLSRTPLTGKMQLISKEYNEDAAI